MVSFQLPLSGSLRHPRPTPSGVDWYIAFNSLSRDHRQASLQASIADRENAFNSLSRDHGSQYSKAKAKVARLIYSFNSLSRNHSFSSATRLPTRSSEPFNSLSRDHRFPSSMRGPDARWNLSTPSLGITSSQASRPSCRLRHRFQLPLSGSHLRHCKAVDYIICSQLSTPSLGITKTSLNCISAADLGFFQLPLSGSPEGEDRERPRRRSRRGLSTPSLGITALGLSSATEACKRLSTPSLGITGGVVEYVPERDDFPFNSLSRDHWGYGIAYQLVTRQTFNSLSRDHIFAGGTSDIR